MLTLPKILKSEDASIFSSSTLARHHQFNSRLNIIEKNRRRGYHSLNRSQIFTEKAKAKFSMQSSLQLEHFNKAYDDGISNEMIAKTTVDAMNRSPKIR